MTTLPYFQSPISLSACDMILNLIMNYHDILYDYLRDADIARKLELVFRSDRSYLFYQAILRCVDMGMEPTVTNVYAVISSNMTEFEDLLMYYLPAKNIATILCCITLPHMSLTEFDNLLNLKLEEVKNIEYENRSNGYTDHGEDDEACAYSSRNAMAEVGSL